MKKIFYLFFILLAISRQGHAQCWQKIATGGSHTLAIKDNGTLWAWGNNFHGALGDGAFTNRSAPVQIGTDANWAIISANETPNGTPKNNFSLAIKTDGTLWAWGSNNNGELGLGDFTPRSTPVQVGSNTNWVNISAGSQASAALRTNGTIWTWGLNTFGQLGDGTNTDRNTPGQVGTATDWQIVSNSGLHMMAIKSTGTLWGWGQNSFGQLGNGTINNSNVPLQIGTDSDWDTTVCGHIITIALKTNGTRWAWGSNTAGEYGTGNLDYYTDPFQTGAETDWQTISVKSYTAFGIRIGSNLWASGLNEFGQIGDGTTVNKLSPVQVSCNITLPVTWLSITGKLQNNTAIIEWATASETNNSHFEIEHSSNASSFTKAGTVNAAGNSTSTTNYSFTHLSPVDGKNYYRIKQVDADGRFTYSRIVTLLDNNEKNSIVLSPNPAQNFIQLNTSTTRPATIRIYSMEGKLVQQQQIPAGNQQRSIDISKLPAGMYSLQLQTSELSKTTSFIKQ